MHSATAFLLGIGTSALLYYTSTQKSLHEPTAELTERLGKMRADLVGAVERSRSDWEQRLSSTEVQKASRSLESKFQMDQWAASWNQLVMKNVERLQNYRLTDRIIDWTEKLQRAGSETSAKKE